MKKLNVFVVVLAVLLSILTGVAVASHHGECKEQKKAILLVAFRSSEDSVQISFVNIDKSAKKAYSDIPVKWAYTPHIFIKKLASQGELLDTTEVALAKIVDEGFTHVAVQSLHTIAGAEYHDLRRVVASFQTMDGFESIILGYPMLATQEDMVHAIDAILAPIPKDRKKEEAVNLMRHGTHHSVNVFYAALMLQIQLKDPNIYLGTVEGFPDLDTVLTLLKKYKVQKAYLIPFISVAWDHAKNDMAGDEDYFWKSILSKAGIKCVPVLKRTIVDPENETVC